MGVLNTASTPFIHVIEEVLEGIDDLEHIEQQEAALPPRPVRRPRQRVPPKPFITSMVSNRSGTKKKRRHDNVMYLVNMAEETDLDELTIEDFSPVSMSAFAQLLMEREKMKVWNDFIEQSEDDQMKILHNHLDEVENSNPAPEETEQVDKRFVHPAFSADQSFKRLDRSLRSLFKKNRVPLASLHTLEEELMTFFNTYPKAVYMAQLENGYDRLLLHALCQYLELKSNSYTLCGVRHTKVKNPRREFQVPPILLSTYIEEQLWSLS